jgi:hypothetical protein
MCKFSFDVSLPWGHKGGGSKPISSFIWIKIIKTKEILQILIPEINTAVVLKNDSFFYPEYSLYISKKSPENLNIIL